MRLPTDPFSFYIHTSDPRDNKKIMDLVEGEGLTVAQAIRLLAEERP
jgi:hypothetical protein